MADFSPLSTLKRMTTGAAQTLTTLGRFELKRMLGQGAQSQVWLAFDPRLEREVAIKLMKPVDGPNASAIAQWLQEARSVSRLTHAHIVPVFEADVHEQQPYLVFEYVPGQTLTDLVAKQGALPAEQAAQILQDVLSALVAAHTGGVVHRDLKPSNVLIDASGRARVMDFGIAVRLGSASSQTSDTAGTPAYMAPEAARGSAVTPLMDVYSAGLLFAEMLSGKPLMAEADPYRAIYRAAHEPLKLPAHLLSGVDDQLRAILLRALAHEPELRFPSAQVFLDALKQWQGQGASADGNSDAGAAGSKNGTLDFLLRRMRHKSDFPALSESIVRIQSMANSEKESVSSVTNEILKDVALTNKLLRLVNSAHFSRGSSIGTVSRAVTLVGFNGIRNMALSLVLLEHMQDKTNAHLLKEEFLRALMSGSIAAELGSSTREGEEAFIGALFQNLGRMLSQFYFPEEAASIRNLVTAQRDPISEIAAATRVLGMSFESLGLGVSKAWGLPESIQKCIVQPIGDPPSRTPSDVQERLRWTARAANEMADAMLNADPGVVESQLMQLAKRFGKTLGLSVGEVQTATTAARKKLVELAQAMDLTVPAGSRASNLLRGTDAAGHTLSTGAVPSQDALTASELHATQTLASRNATPAQRNSEHVSQTLAAGVQDITNAMVEDFKLTDVLRMILEAMFRALDFHRIIFCMRDPKIDMLTGRFGLGPGVEGVVKSFCVPLHVTGKPDLFATVCAKGADTLISDASDPRIAASLPAWYRQTFNAPTFLILPLLIKGKSFGLIYADKSEKGGLVVDEKELALLRTLRNQAIMAFKQSS